MGGRKLFSAGEVLQAADVNDFLMDQSVMVFAGSAARGSAIPSPTEGMVTYRSDDDVVEVFDGSVFKAVGPGQILQVVSTTKTDAFSVTVNASTLSGDVTGLTATITPTSASNKVLVVCNVPVSMSVTPSPFDTVLHRDGSAIGVGDASGSRARSTAGGNDTADGVFSVSSSFLDSPAGTSALTYSVRLRHGSGSTRTMHVNRGNNDTDTIQRSRYVSTITLMEVAG